MNVGNPDEFTMVELADRVLELTGASSELGFRELPHDDPQQRRPDISLARTELAWEPRVSLDEGLRLTVDHFRRTLGATSGA